MDNRLVGGFAAHARYFIAGFLFLAPPEQDKNHKHARLDDVRVDLKRLIESGFRLFKVVGAAQALENTIDMARAQAVISQAKLRIEFDRAAKMSDGRIAILGRDGAEDEAREAIAAAQEFVVGFGVDCLWLCQPC